MSGNGKPLGTYLSNGIMTAAEAGRYVSGGILFLMAFYITADVVSRYFFSAPFRGTLEMSQMMLAAIVFLAIADVEASGGNVRVEIFTEHRSARTQAILGVLYAVLGLFFLAMLFKDGMATTLEEIRGGLTTDQLRIPSFPGRLVIPLGAFLMALVILVDFFRRLRKAMRGA